MTAQPQRFPVERLTEFADEIGASVAWERAHGRTDEDIVHIAVVPVDGDASHSSGEYMALRARIAQMWPELRHDYAKRKPGHVTVLILAPEGNAVFGVKIAKARK